MAGGPRHRRRSLLLVPCGLLVAWAAWLGVSMYGVARDVVEGRRAMRAAQALADPIQVAAGDPLPALEQARRHFTSAHSRLEQPLWAPVRALPVLGRQLRSLTALTAAGHEVAAIGIDGVGSVREVLGQPSPRGQDRVSAIRRLADIAGEMEARLTSISTGPRLGLLSPLARRRNELIDRLEQVQVSLARVDAGGNAVADLLSGPRRYLVLAANNSEMRAGAGMFLSVGELETAGGNMRLSEMISVEELLVPTGAVEVHGDMIERWGWLKPNEEWRNLMLSPRFDASAALAARMWRASGHPPVDGVMALDAVALRAVLAATGPVAATDQTISAENVVEYLTHAQYLRFPTQRDVAHRRDELGQIAQATFDALNRGQPALPVLARGFAEAVGGRHIMLWSANESEMAGWRAAGADGTVGESSILLAVLNRGGNKLDRYLDVSAELTFSAQDGETLCSLRVVLFNRAPTGEPAYVIGPEPTSGVGEGVYLGIFAATLPKEALGSHIAGVEQLAVAGADGPSRVVGVQVAIPRGQSHTFEVRFRLPGGGGRVVVEPSARIPPIAWKAQGGSWPDGARHVVTW